MKTGARRHVGNPVRILKKISYMAALSIILQAAFYFDSRYAYARDDRPVSHTKIDAGQGTTLNVIEVDLTGGLMEVNSAGANNYTTRENFATLIHKSNAVAAINGCFFDMKSGKLVGKVYHDGKRAVAGDFSAAFAVEKYSSRPVIAAMGDLGEPKNYSVIISCVDILMKNGKILVNSKSDLVRNGHDPSNSNDIYHSARWTAIGIGRSGKVYFVVTPNRISIYRFIKEVKEHTEITDLLGMDGGTSSGMYFDGKMLVRPARTIPSIIVARPATVRPAAVASR